jgi:hypothetical protein
MGTITISVSNIIYTVEAIVFLLYAVSLGIYIKKEKRQTMAAITYWSFVIVVINVVLGIFEQDIGNWLLVVGGTISSIIWLILLSRK